MSGGSPRRFCSSVCRAALHRAARQWALAEIDAGRLSVPTIAGVLAKLQISETIYPHDEGYAHGDLVLAAIEDLERLAKA